MNAEDDKQQMMEEEYLVNLVGEKHFTETPKEKFITMPENMTASEYKEWRKNNKDLNK